MDQGTNGQRKTIYGELAEEIAADLSGAAYYKDPKILTDLLKARFSLSESKAVEVANAVVADLQGAGYYKDPAILADFLKGAKGQDLDPIDRLGLAALVLERRLVLRYARLFSLRLDRHDVLLPGPSQARVDLRG